VVPDQAAIDVECPLYCLNRGMSHSCRCRQEDGDWIRRVQCDQAVGDFWEVVGPSTRQQQVPFGKPCASLLSIDVCRHASTVAIGTDSSRFSGSVRVQTFGCRAYPPSITARFDDLQRLESTKITIQSRDRGSKTECD